MNIVAISGSQHKKGNTAILISMIIKEIRNNTTSKHTISFYSIGKKAFKPCKGCKACIKKGRCTIKSDDWDRIAKKMLKADLIIIGSPVFFHDISGPLKTFMDRTYSLWHARQLKGTRIIAVVVSKRSETARALESITLWAQLHEMKIIATVCGKRDAHFNIKSNASCQKSVKKAVKIALGITTS